MIESLFTHFESYLSVKASYIAGNVSSKAFSEAQAHWYRVLKSADESARNIILNLKNQERRG